MKNSLSYKYDYIIRYFQENNPDAESELHYKDAYQLAVAVILSAQCTDKRVNMVTPAFYERFPSPETLSKGSFEEVYTLIKSISYPNNKAKHLIGMAQMLVNDFNGEVPKTMDELIKLPGVGRKTANVLLAVYFDQPAMPVDTHVFRVANRLGIVKNATTPLEVEKQLVKGFPTILLSRAHHWLILHGRYICLARKPKCDQCGLTAICNFYQEAKK